MSMELQQREHQIWLVDGLNAATGRIRAGVLMLMIADLSTLAKLDIRARVKHQKHRWSYQDQTRQNERTQRRTRCWSRMWTIGTLKAT